MSNKKLIGEQVLYRIASGYPDTSYQVDIRDIYKAIEQKVNSKFRLRHFNATLPSGNTMPEHAMIATYENIAVTSLGNGKSQSLLPVTPISLPLNMGIYMVYDPRYPDNFFIPLQRSQLALLRADELLNNLMGMIGFEPKNNVLLFTQDITMFGTSSITMELAVFDMSQYADTDKLPIPADLEDEIVNELVNDFSPVQPETGDVNNYTNAPSQIPVK